MTLILHDSEIILWEKIMHFECLTLVAMLTFLKHHFDYIIVTFPDQNPQWVPIQEAL